MASSIPFMWTWACGGMLLFFHAQELTCMRSSLSVRSSALQEKADYDTNIAAVKGAVTAIEKGMVGSGFLQTSGGKQLHSLMSDSVAMSSFS